MSSWLYRQQPSLGVSIHCITIFLVRLTLLMIVSLWLRKRGIQETEQLSRRLGRSKGWIEVAVNVLSIWVPLRLMCPSVVLRVGRWWCNVAASVLPTSLDLFNAAADSPAFWIAYAWVEIAVFASMLYIVSTLKKWPNFHAYGHNVGAWLGHLKDRIPRRKREKNSREPRKTHPRSSARQKIPKIVVHEADDLAYEKVSDDISSDDRRSEDFLSDEKFSDDILSDEKISDDVLSDVPEDEDFDVDVDANLPSKRELAARMEAMRGSGPPPRRARLEPGNLARVKRNSNVSGMKSTICRIREITFK